MLGELGSKMYTDWISKQKQALMVSEEFSPEDYPFYNTDSYQDADETEQTFWTDIFVYWQDEPEVREGSILAFFSDLNDPK